MYQIYFARCMNIFNSLLAQLVKYDVHTTRKINLIHAIFYHILSLSVGLCSVHARLQVLLQVTRLQSLPRVVVMISETLNNTHIDAQTNCFCPVILVDQPHELKNCLRYVKLQLQRLPGFY